MYKLKLIFILWLIISCFSSIDSNSNELNTNQTKEELNDNQRNVTKANNNLKVVSKLDINSNEDNSETTLEVVEDKVSAKDIRDEKIESQNKEKDKYAINLYNKALLMTNMKSAYTLFQESAKLSHKKSIELVAKSYLFGDHLPIDTKLAKDYFERLTQNQSSSSQIYLGFMYSIGLGVKSSQSKAIMYYRLAANNGNLLAQMALAFRHKLGIAVDMNCESALNFYHKVATDVVEELAISGGIPIQNHRLTDENKISGLDRDLIQYFEFLAKRGDIEAQVSCGQLYYYGENGVNRDLTVAMNYFRKAAKVGNGNALAFLGKIYFEGINGLKPDYKRALHYYEKSAKLGNPIGKSGLGFMYLYGKGVDIDYQKAFEYFSSSASQGWTEAHLQLGVIYLNGFGVAHDYRIAMKYFLMASQSGHVLGYYHLAEMHASGRGTVRSCSSAVPLFKAVAEKGRQFGEISMEANDDYKSRRITQALLKYAFLAELGSESAQTNAAFIIENDKLVNIFSKTKRQKLQLMYWTRAADQGYSYARVKVGDHHYYGLGTKVDYEKAVFHYKMATIDSNNGQSLFNLGLMYESGLGVKRNLRSSDYFYKRAAQTSSEAEVAVFLAKLKLKLLTEYLGQKWDLYLIFGLVIALCFVIYLKMR